MHLEPNEIHLWLADLTPFLPLEAANRATLSQDECQRADRFSFPIHRQRYLAARSILRDLLSHYLKLPPAGIQLGYTDKQKPYLLGHHTLPLQFNLSHSDNMALYGFTLTHAIGVDIEKVKTAYDPDIPIRFFSKEEQDALQNKPAEAFFRVWARKEAVLKACGKGLSVPLSSFSVSAEAIEETITLENLSWTVSSVDVNHSFQAAVASNQLAKKISKFIFNDQT